MIQLHKVTIFVVSADDILNDSNPLDKLHGDCYHNSGAKILEIETVEFDREWTEDDPLNKTSNVTNRAYLDEQMLEGKKVT